MVSPWERELGDVAAFDMMDEAESHYLRELGTPPFNLSHWESGDQYRLMTRHLLPVQNPLDFFSYRYSHEISDRFRALRMFGYDIENSECLLCPNGTSAISAAFIFIKKFAGRVFVIGPNYFSIDMLPSLYGIPAENIIRPKGGLAEAVGSLERNDAIVLTNPVYSVGTPRQTWEIRHLEEAQERGAFVIVDECICPLGSYVALPMSIRTELISIHAPHKSIGVNGLKFGAVAFPKKYQNHFYDHADIHIGAIGSSSAAALAHFCSPKYLDMQRIAQDFMSRARANLTAMAGNVHFPPRSAGCFVSCYFPEQPATLISRPEQFLAFMRATGASVIPNRLNRIEAECFSFRLNLLRYSTRMAAAFKRVCAYINEL